MSVSCIQDIFKCDTCKYASNEFRFECKHGLLFPLLLFIAEKQSCDNYELDVEKIKNQLKTKEA